ncbi:MAG: hypothetical protein J3K34DRAFT_149542 [Monoraphidium minutum]|nr:MAG: hypothetical protein J3K34DRAFT_149542 [Monoraphidium minutum]
MHKYCAYAIATRGGIQRLFNKPRPPRLTCPSSSSSLGWWTFTSCWGSTTTRRRKRSSAPTARRARSRPCWLAVLSHQEPSGSGAAALHSRPRPAPRACALHTAHCVRLSPARASAHCFTFAAIHAGGGRAESEGEVRCVVLGGPVGLALQSKYHHVGAGVEAHAGRAPRSV